MRGAWSSPWIDGPLALLAILIWRIRRGYEGYVRDVTASAFVLLYLGRPVGWGFAYLDIVLLVALRPVLRPRALTRSRRRE